MSDQPSSNQRPIARPGSMTMAMEAVRPSSSGPKVLRIALIEQGRIVSERIVRAREPITVGSAEDNHFVIAGIGARFVLFVPSGDGYALNATREMRGRLGTGSGPREIDELRETGWQLGSHVQIALAPSARGKVVIGASTLLFQLVEPPPMPTRPQLPAAVSGSFLRGIDWLFTAFVAFSFVGHFAFVVLLDNADWPIDAAISTISARDAEWIVHEPPPPELPEIEEPPSNEVSEDALPLDTETLAETDAPRPSSTPRPSNPPPSTPTSDELAMIRDRAIAQAEHLILTGEGPGSGAFGRVLQGGAITEQAGAVLAEVESVTVAQNADSQQFRDRVPGPLPGGDNDIGHLAVVPGEPTRPRPVPPPPEERRIPSHIGFPAEPEDEEGTGDFDRNLVIRMIRLRQAQIRACYEHELRNDETLSGRVSVTLTIQESGSVTDVRALDNTVSPAVGACVVRVVRGFRFTEGAEGGSVTYSFPFVFEPQG